jgi:hypothetical protein
MGKKRIEKKGREHGEKEKYVNVKTISCAWFTVYM